MNQNSNTPLQEGYLKRYEKEAQLNQKGHAFWFVGLSGSGKSTLAKVLERKLHEKGFYTLVLDGDNIRNGLNAGLGFTPEDRLENVRRLAHLAKLSLENGAIVLVPVISPVKEHRDFASKIIGKSDFSEIYVECSINVCEHRDVKGLYAKARSGLIPNFTGVNDPFEVPENPDFLLQTSNNSDPNKAWDPYWEEVIDNISKRKGLGD